MKKMAIFFLIVLAIALAITIPPVWAATGTVNVYSFKCNQGPDGKPDPTLTQPPTTTKGMDPQTRAQLRVLFDIDTRQKADIVRNSADIQTLNTGLKNAEEAFKTMGGRVSTLETKVAALEGTPAPTPTVEKTPAPTPSATPTLDGGKPAPSPSPKQKQQPPEKGGGAGWLWWLLTALLSILLIVMILRRRGRGGAGAPAAGGARPAGRGAGAGAPAGGGVGRRPPVAPPPPPPPPGP